MAVCSPSELLESGKCFDCLTERQLRIIIAQLLCEILENGGGGSNSLSHGSGPPVAAPADPANAAIYYDGDAASPSYDTEWHWDTDLQIWIGT